jgi:hypothetical protein
MDEHEVAEVSVLTNKDFINFCVLASNSSQAYVAFYNFVEKQNPGEIINKTDFSLKWYYKVLRVWRLWHKRAHPGKNLTEKMIKRNLQGFKSTRVKSSFLNEVLWRKDKNCQTSVPTQSQHGAVKVVTLPPQNKRGQFLKQERKICEVFEDPHTGQNHRESSRVKSNVINEFSNKMKEESQDVNLQSDAVPSSEEFIFKIKKEARDVSSDGDWIPDATHVPNIAEGFIDMMGKESRYAKAEPTTSEWSFEIKGDSNPNVNCLSVEKDTFNDTVVIEKFIEQGGQKVFTMPQLLNSNLHTEKVIKSLTQQLFCLKEELKVNQNQVQALQLENYKLRKRNNFLESAQQR